MAFVIEDLVQNRLIFVTDAEGAIVTSFKQEVYWELHEYFDVLEADVLDDSQYSEPEKSLMADIVSCYMLNRQAIIESLGEAGKISGTNFVNVSGSPLDDMVASGVYTGTGNALFEVTIDGQGTPDSFKWSKDGVEIATGVSITGTAQLLSDGIFVTFGATTGHGLADIWIVSTVALSDNKAGFFKKGKAGSAEVEFEQRKSGGVNAGASLSMSSVQLLDNLKNSAYRKGHNLTVPIVFDICGDCLLAIDFIYLNALPTPFIVTQLGPCNELPPDNCC